MNALHWLLALLLPGLPQQVSEQRQGSALGGSATVHVAGQRAFSYPVPTLSAIERRAFAVGNAFFNDNWVAAPASAAGRDGLGPLFLARSCSACHLRDGRGRPPEPGEDAVTGLLLRLGIPGEAGDRPAPRYGGQLQDRALPGLAPEGRVRITGRSVPGEYADGTRFELLAPSYSLVDPGYGEPHGELVLGPRVAPQMIGLGLLEAIAAADLVARADPEDVDGDGVSGRVHWVLDRRSGERVPGRFGWKATEATVEQQVAAAFVNDIGITSSLFPGEAVEEGQLPAGSYVSGGEPELSDHKLQRVAFYSAVLGVPAQRGAAGGAPEGTEGTVERGAELFRSLGCAACHTPTWTTGESSIHAGLGGQAIHPFTDLLLHDMGRGLADGKRDGDAGPAEWRTPPLWGIGLFGAVNGHTRYLHDGRARSLEEAVLWHGGEAQEARAKFTASSAGERRALLAFLASL